MKLKRRKVADMVVISSAEKYRYAHATLEPLLNHLSNLSSEKFYEQLKQWEFVLADASNDKNCSTSSNTANAPSGTVHMHVVDGSSAVSRKDREEHKPRFREGVREAEEIDSYTFLDLFEFGDTSDDMVKDIDADTSPDNLTGVRAPAQHSCLDSESRVRGVDEAQLSIVATQNDVAPEMISGNYDHRGDDIRQQAELSKRTIDVLTLPAVKKRNTTRKAPKQSQLILCVELRL